MNTFRTTTNDGGLPLRNDDFEFMQDAYKSIFSAILRAYSDVDTTFFLTGGVSDTVSIYSDGYLFKDGKIYQFNSYTFSTEQDVYIHDEIVYDPTGNKSFKSGLSYDTYEIHRCYFDETATGGATFDIQAYTIQRFEYALIEKLFNNSGGQYYLSLYTKNNYNRVWTALSYFNSYTAIVTEPELKYTVNPYGDVNISGTVYKNASPVTEGATTYPGVKIGTLPSAIYPSSRKFLPIYNADSKTQFLDIDGVTTRAVYGKAFLVLETNGDVKIFLADFPGDPNLSYYRITATYTLGW